MTQDPNEIEKPVPASDDARAATWGSDPVVDVLRELDVPYIPLNPGSSYRGLHDSLVNYGGNRGPQIMLCLHEEIAVSMANGWAKATGRLGVAAIHDLVGLMHASMAVYDAYSDRTPMLLLGGSGPMDHSLRRPIDWVHTADTQAQLVRNYVVWDAEPTTAQDSVDDVATAARHALSVPTGPAYVSLDSGLMEAPLERPVKMPNLAARPAVTELAAPAEQISRAIDRLLAAERPVIVVGGQASFHPDTTPVLRELVELLGASYQDERNFVAMPSLHPQNCNGDRGVLEEADVMLAVDVRDVAKLLTLDNPAQPDVIDLTAARLDRRSWSNALAAPFDCAVQLAADPRHGLRQLLDEAASRIGTDDRADRRARVAERAAEIRTRNRERIEEHWDDDPISQARLVSELWDAVRDTDHLLCTRNHRSWPEGYWEFEGAGTYLGAAAGGGVGYAPGALIGGALAARDRGQLGIGILGDGDFSMAPGALWTAAHYRIPAVIVVNNNASFYNDEPHQARMAKLRDRPVENSWIGMRVADPGIDFADVARGFGCIGIGPITEPGDLAAAMAEAVAQAKAGATVLVDVHTARG